jgi:uncharacterized protein (DUF302 family)
MTEYRRRIVLDADFDVAVEAVERRLEEEGLQVLAHVDARERLKAAGSDLRRYVLVEVWSPDLVFEAFKRDLDVGPTLPAAIAVYELADGESMVVATEPLLSVVEDAAWQAEDMPLVRLAAQQTERVARALDRLPSRRLPNAAALASAA